MKKHLLIAIFIIITISAFLLASCDKKTSKNNGEADEKETEMSFYEYCYSKASGQKQIDELDELSEDKSLGWGEWRRDALVIIGELPEDIGRVTLNDAEKIVDKDMGDSENIAYFNEIAGAPDWMGGSGIGRAIYYLNDEKTEAVMCILGEVNYFVIKENGEYVQLPIGNQVLPEPVIVVSKQPKYDEENQKSLIMDDYLGYIKSNKETDYDKILTDIPIYNFDEFVIANYDCGFLLGRDSGFYTHSPNTRRDYARTIFTVFPTTAIRESESNEYIYAVYDTDLGIRVFLFFSKEKNDYNTLDGFPIAMSKSMSCEAFSDIKIGDKASKVEKIDSIIKEYTRAFDNSTDEWLEIHIKKGAGPTSIHLLTDGILKIEYKRIALGDYEITNIEYNEDFILTGLNGDTCYKIADCDYVNNEG